MKIYHFANETIGPGFFKVFEKIKEDFPQTQIVLVVSSLSYNKFLKKFPWFLKRSLKNKYQINETYHKLIVTRNINDSRFAKIINDRDIAFVTGFNQIFSKELISKFYKIVNFHPSLLPFYRGPVPSYWVLKNKEKSTGFTFHYLTEKIDDGEILLQKEIKIADGESADILDKELARLGGMSFFNLAMDLIKNKPFSKVTIDARIIYYNHVDYKSFPKNF